MIGDPILATTFLDRLLNYSHIFRGNSYRLHEKIGLESTALFYHLTNNKPGRVNYKSALITNVRFNS
ncbi:hypothetical protein [Brevibacillus thermoruber]|uniref:hypothetical protein n=1 Tax=Brevibacillus thermoruber TaxID=33942 RepID=UPI002F34F757